MKYPLVEKTCCAKKSLLVGKDKKRSSANAYFDYIIFFVVNITINLSYGSINSMFK